jgi:glycosyltransferase involved in cell wall biosynthesis
MFRHAKAIIGGSSQTCGEFSAYRDKVFFVPENGINPSQVGTASRPPRGEKLRLIFVGRLVPYKACDLALRAVARLLRAGRATFDIVGDGAERSALEQLARELGIGSHVSFSGWLTHAETIERLRQADVLVFPSIREFGGGNIFEALAMGVVPIVVAFGGPGDIVTPAIGYSVALTNPDDVVVQMERALDELDRDPARLERMGQEGMRYAREQLTWDGKAQAVTRILTWAVGTGPKPDLPPPQLNRATG